MVEAAVAVISGFWARRPVEGSITHVYCISDSLQPEEQQSSILQAKAHDRYKSLLSDRLTGKMQYQVYSEKTDRLFYVPDRPPAKDSELPINSDEQVVQVLLPVGISSKLLDTPFTNFGGECHYLALSVRPG